MTTNLKVDSSTDTRVTAAITLYHRAEEWLLAEPWTETLPPAEFDEHMERLAEELNAAIEDRLDEYRQVVAAGWDWSKGAVVDFLREREA